MGEPCVAGGRREGGGVVPACLAGCARRAPARFLPGLLLPLARLRGRVADPLPAEPPPTAPANHPTASGAPPFRRCSKVEIEVREEMARLAEEQDKAVAAVVEETQRLVSRRDPGLLPGGKRVAHSLGRLAQSRPCCVCASLGG